MPYLTNVCCRGQPMVLEFGSGTSRLRFGRDGPLTAVGRGGRHADGATVPSNGLTSARYEMYSSFDVRIGKRGNNQTEEQERRCSQEPAESEPVLV